MAILEHQNFHIVLLEGGKTNQGELSNAVAIRRGMTC